MVSLFTVAKLVGKKGGLFVSNDWPKSMAATVDWWVVSAHRFG